MFKNTADIQAKHKAFIKEAVEAETVWTLSSEEGIVTSSSIHVEEENGDAVKLLLFWSSDKRARVCSRHVWQGKFEPEAIPLIAFIENWCIGMYGDGILCGTNFDHQMFGHEIEPLELILELVAELKVREKTLLLEKFDSLTELEKEVKEVIDDL